MTRSEIETALAAAIDAESLVGIRWWPGREMAPIAFRRWSSFDRRWRAVKRRHRTRTPTFDDRVIDMAKGLQAHFEPEIPYTEFGEFVHLAGLLIKALEGLDS
jgi:hypothetical protein